MSYSGLTNAETERLALLAEELGEAIQAIGKVLRHGYWERHPNGGPDNRETLEAELGDVLAAMTLMEEEHDIVGARIHAAKCSKLTRVGRYLHHQDSGLLGSLADEYRKGGE